MQRVVTSIAIDTIIAVATVNRVIGYPAIETIIAICSIECKDLFGDICHFQRLIIKLEMEMAVVVIVEITPQGYLITVTIGIDDKVVTITAEAGICRFRTFKP